MKRGERKNYKYDITNKQIYDIKNYEHKKDTERTALKHVGGNVLFAHANYFLFSALRW